MSWKPSPNVPRHLTELAHLLRLDILAVRQMADTVFWATLADGREVRIGTPGEAKSEATLNHGLGHIDRREPVTLNHRDSGRVARILSRLGEQHQEQQEAVRWSE